ncbi:unnamed protein product, partial [Laminaria digitata]
KLLANPWLLVGRTSFYIYVYVYLSNFRTFSNFSLRTSTFRRNTRYPDTVSPAGLIGQGLGAIRAIWSAWRALKVFFPAGVHKTISLVSVREALFCTCTNVPVKCRKFFARPRAHSPDMYR